MFRVLFLILFLLSSVALSFFSKPPLLMQKSVTPIPKPTTVRMLDTIGKASDKDLIARFEAVRIELSDEPTSIAYIINYGTKKQIQKRERQIKKALAFHKIDQKSVEIISAGNPDVSERGIYTKIYIVPAAVVPPTP